MAYEEYKEGKFSLVRHENEIYKVDDLILATKSKPVTNIPVNDLDWIMKHVSTKNVSRGNTSLEHPIIVLEEDGKKYTLDGVHRLRQAMNVMDRTIKACVLTRPEMPLPVHHVCDDNYELISYTPGPLTCETKSLLNDFATSVGEGVTPSDLLKSPFIYLLCKNYKQLGFVSFKILEDGSVYVSAFGVRSGYRNHGYGSILMDEFIKLIMSRSRFQQIKLGVRSDNIVPKKLYTRLGFTHISSGIDSDIPFDTFVYINRSLK